MWQQMDSFLKSFFIYPDLEWHMMLIGIGLGLAFGAVWLAAHWPPLFKKYRLWIVAVFSAFFTLLAVTFVQIPFQHWIGQALEHFWDPYTLINWLMLAGIPQILMSGLVQEGAKMVPIVFWWWRSDRKLTPKMGLAIGAMAGAGFGIFEAVWVHNLLFAAGWNLDMIFGHGFTGIAGFWERFFVIGFHIAASSLAGYGLAKGKGWQFYLIVAATHFMLNYSVLFRAKGYFDITHSETWLAGIAILITAAVLWLRWRKDEEETDLADDAGEPTGEDI